MSEARQPLSPSLGRADLGTLLLESEALTPEQLEEARERQAEQGGRLLDHLDDLASPEALMEALSRQLALPIRTHIDKNELDADLLEKVSIAFAKEHDILPLGTMAALAAPPPPLMTVASLPTPSRRMPAVPSSSAA